MPPAATDLEVLVPRIKRALFGPVVADQPTVDDDDLLAIAADAIAALILFAPSAFGYKLLVKTRDATYGAPATWETDTELSEEAQVVVAMQAALDWHVRRLTTLKTSETIKDESTEHSWAVSAQAMRDHFKFLQAERDRALDALGRLNPALDTYISSLAVRDIAVSRAIEPWFDGAGAGGLDVDWRFQGA